MSNELRDPDHHSPLAPLMERYVQQRQACGYRYDEARRILARLDRFLCEHGLDKCELPRTLYRTWLLRQPNESVGTQQVRVSVVRQFALYMCRHEYKADVPDRSFTAKPTSLFTPRVFTRAEVAQLLQAVDELRPTARAPLRHLVMRELFRLLYGCGLRVSEALHLRVGDVDLVRGVLTTRDTKFGKDRLVPPALALMQRLQRYADALGPRPPDAYFFPSEGGRPRSLSGVYHLFRKLLMRCGIPHGGRGKGPRVHDLRHSHAVHALLHWCREGADLDAKLPVLATYLGHQSLQGTQDYLHLTVELFPEVVKRANAAFEDVIPRRPS
ncbi:tyrosine-type recombinase/integrase [Variovorax sp. J22R133]|uniref:tyrosine-type recombinase/integrase n=1 Tax=Variovorax brevis TaxID=3053503 RepID=UPI002578C3A0|nr:tyrosine-type recombinase/integrase [Variovorax sp. J22R133]MDM0117896.1 tyrosine-type recombinase/integrase [Variovorax sp. J22R133]